MSHVRFNVPPAAYTSGLGNLMLAVVAYDGADFDLVGLGVNARDDADTTAPPIPSAPTLTPVAGGVPMFAYQRWSDGALCFTHGTDMYGNAWSTPVVIDDSINCGYVSLIWLAGRPAIAYYDSTNGDLRYISAADSNGDTWYPPIMVDTDGDVGEFCSLVFLPSLGVPCISYVSGAGELKAAIAADFLGDNWIPPVTARKGVWDRCMFTNIAIVEGLPGISYYNDADGECYFAYPRIN